MLSRRGKYLIVLALTAFFAAPLLRAATLGSSKLQFSDLKRINADTWNIAGKNIIVSGNVYIPFGDLEIFADKAVINVENKDIEVTGNIQFYRWQSTGGNVTPARLAELEDTANVLVSVTGLTGNLWGDKTISVKASGLTDNLKAHRLVGNLESGYFSFNDVQLKFQTFICKAKSGERKPDGIIYVRDAEISSCEYLESDSSHYSISCSEAQLTPHITQFYGMENIDTDPGDHTVLLTNGFFRVYGVPILWLPVFYKPKDESPGLFSIQYGEDSDWGYYLLMSKRFYFLDYPSVFLNLEADIYEKRGFGYGGEIRVSSEESRTQILVYSMWDRDPFKSDDYYKYRIEVPHGRYDFRIANVTHLTPRLDFRGVFEYSSDPYFVRDFFEPRYNANPNPATYAALEQQFDHFSASLYFRPQVNSFYSTVQRLPSFRVDVPRQELFGTNLYYQGDLSLDYLKMNWIEFDEKPKRFYEDSELRNYEAFRFDNTHFFYYPLRLFDFLSIVPRAGFKMTAYSNSSKEKVTPTDLLLLFNAADPEGTTAYHLRNYDDDGGSRFRFAGELGLEASTKIYNTWQDVRSSWLELDGLRHVMRPYLNYTFIPKPTVSRDYLYYFDEIDRIDEQNFLRIGLDNRLQTRSGNTVRDYLTMENYWDLHFNRGGDEDNLSHVGDFCTILTATPFKGVTLSTEFSIDAGGNNGDVPDTTRGNVNVGKKGLAIDWLNRWIITLSYSPIDDVNFNFSYNYRRPYASRSAYSMGSTLTQFDAGSFFDKYFDDYDETFTFGMSFPLTPDRRTFGAYSMSYDVLEGYVDTHQFQILRKLHCWEVALDLMLEQEREGGHGRHTDISYGFSIYLTGMTGPLQEGQNSILNSTRGALNNDSENGGWL